MKKVITAQYLRYVLFFCFFLGFATSSTLIAQQSSLYYQPDDSIIIFTPSRPFIEKVETTRRLRNGAGFNIIFSSNGFGLGGFYQREISPSLTLLTDFFFSGKQNSDEIEYADFILQRYIVPGKINRLFVVPLMFGLQYKLDVIDFADVIKPYLQIGIGPSMVISTPYMRNNTYYEFFSSFGDGIYYVRPGGYIGAGISLPSIGNTISTAFARYYFVPFGGEGLESMDSAATLIPPIQNFGGLFFTITIGWKF